MPTPKILIQLDSDSHASSFDAVVAVDAGVDQLLQYANIEASKVQGLVHGAMFTRSPADLRNTAIFIGGSNVMLGEAIGKEIAKTFFGPIRVSTMFDGNGSNTTAAAAVLCANRHIPPDQTTALVLGGTGPVGGRVARLLLRNGAKVYLTSRDVSRAASAKEGILEQVGGAAEDSSDTRIHAIGSDAIDSALPEANVVFGCGAAGYELLSEEKLCSATNLRVAIDLNAVPPAGLGGIGVNEKAMRRGDRVDYGAIGVGGLKMKIHRRAIQKLFEQNDASFDAEEIFAIGQELEAAR
ncbi:MAG: NAD(P)-dependent methylenetetrahydromethanopterin dehydrogenase [Planctomycetota bacterium]|nr:NAD(P)-dependent methylenetetrahydromethanopterin dehydrogenase [Planctomycetota bacterium]